MNLLKRGGSPSLRIPNSPSPSLPLAHSPSRSRSRSLSPNPISYHTPQMGGENSAFKALGHHDSSIKSLSQANALKLSQSTFDSAFKPHPSLDNSAFKALVPNAAALLAAQSIQLQGYDSQSDSDEEINVHDSDDETEKNKVRSRSPSPRQRMAGNDLPLQLTKHDR